MTPLRQRMLEDMQLAGYARRTIQSYLDTVIVLTKPAGVKASRGQKSQQGSDLENGKNQRSS